MRPSVHQRPPPSVTWADRNRWVPADAREPRRMRLRMRLQPKATTDSGELDRRYLARPDARRGCAQGRSRRIAPTVGIRLCRETASHWVIGGSRRTRAEPPFGTDIGSMPIGAWLAHIWVAGCRGSTSSPCRSTAPNSCTCARHATAAPGYEPQAWRW